MVKTLNESREDFNVYGSVHRNNILIYIQQDATLHSLFYLETALYVSGGTTTHYQERIQLYLQYLVFVRPLLLPAAIATAHDPIAFTLRNKTTTLRIGRSVRPRSEPGRGGEKNPAASDIPASHSLHRWYTD